MPQFTYPQEPLPASSIRVLTLQPGHSPDPIICTLHTTPLSTPTPYTALSYVWGSSLSHREILVDSLPFSALATLHAALHHLRSHTTSFPLWTDAICIDQTNNAEKSVQVQQMGRIYAAAAEVVIWLGPADEDSDFALTWLERFVAAGDAGEYVKYPGCLAALCKLFRRPWFQRLWVLQESVLATKATVICGEKRVPFSTLLAFSRLDSAAALPLRSVDPDAYAKDGPAEALNQLTYIGRIREDCERGESWPLASLMLTGRKLKCFDPRDHVFGLVGMAEAWERRTEVVDYGKSVEEVFAKAMKNEMLNLSWGSDLLGAICLEDDQDEAEAKDSWQERLPSWVPNWAQETEVRSFPTHLYHAGGEEFLRIRPEMFSKDDSILTLEGIVVSRVASFTEPWRRLNPDTLLDWEEQVLSLDGPSPYGGHSGRLDAFWRTLVKDEVPRLNRRQPVRWAKNDPGWGYNVFVERAIPMRKSSQEDEDDAWREFTFGFRQAAADALTGRRMIFTEMGHVGLGPSSTVVGDYVVVFKGLHPCYLLRKRQNGGTWCIVGVAYVHGLMDGEMLNEANSSDYGWENFRLN